MFLDLRKTIHEVTITGTPRNLLSKSRISDFLDREYGLSTQRIRMELNEEVQ